MKPPSNAEPWILIDEYGHLLYSDSEVLFYDVGLIYGFNAEPEAVELAKKAQPIAAMHLTFYALEAMDLPKFPEEAKA